MMGFKPILAATAISAVLLALAASAMAQDVTAAITAAVDDAHRPSADRAVDIHRKPAQTLAFAGVAPGQTVAEIFPGTGYYSRLIARVIGPQGRLYTLPWGEPNTGASQRLAHDPAYGNITAVLDNPITFKPDRPLDLFFTTQNYHDIASPQRDQINRLVFRWLKPGGAYFILDHSAKAGSGYSALPLHRIDVALVEKEVERAGFVLEAASDILANPDDDRTRNVFDPAIRGRTDQFLLKFVKPLKP
ncbi:class I SAM-dependent methyltransferase [soil metagenome]